MAITGRINLRARPDQIELFKRAAAIKGVYLTDFIMKVCTHAANNALREAANKEVLTSKPVPEVVEKVRPEPTRVPSVAELYQPGQALYEKYCGLTRQPSIDDFADWLELNEIEFTRFR